MIEEDLRYPIGRWRYPESASTPAERDSWIQNLAETPRALRAAAIKPYDEARWD